MSTARVAVACNAGSSSLKAALFVDGARRVKIVLERLGLSRQRLRVSIAGDAQRAVWCEAESDRAAADLVTRTILRELKLLAPSTIAFVAHRVKFAGAVPESSIFDDSILERLREEQFRSVRHNSLCAAVYEAISVAIPGVPQLAVFDNSFFRAMQSLPAPFRRRIRSRFEVLPDGHHGLACESAYRQLRDMPPRLKLGRIIICHVGSGGSVTALQQGAPIYNSMPYCAYDGPIMNTRSGDIPPGAILTLLHNGYPVAELAGLLGDLSGLYALAEVDPDRDIIARNLLEGAPSSEAAGAYFESYALAIVRATICLGGADVVAFTGGLASNVPGLPAAILQRVPFGRFVPRDGGAVSDGAISTIGKFEQADIVIVDIDEEGIIVDIAGRASLGGARTVVARGRCVCPGIGTGVLRRGDSDSASMIPPGTVAAVSQLTPAAVLVARDAVAIVAGVGSNTCHGAALARELSIPCISEVDLGLVLRCAQTRPVTVDAASGEVRLGD